MQRLIMIMGFQRSGTNALFNSFVKGGDCDSFLDAVSNEIYEDFYLRPEPQIRTFLTGHQKPVLLKPVNETKRRSIDSVLTEYANYDVRVVYIYRDPVNSFFSQTEMWPEFSDVDAFIAQWNARNAYAIDLSTEWKSKFALVKYADLSEDPRVFDQVCDFTGLRGSYLFRSDKNRGRNRMPEETQRKIDDGTRKLISRLDECRTFIPGRRRLSLRKIYRNSRFFLIQQLRKLQLLPNH